MPLYDVAVIEEPTKKEADESGAIEKLLLPPTAVIAKDQNMAAIAVLRAHPDIDLARAKVLVRSFI